MKISEQWLREWVRFPGTTEELAHRLTMAGLEVDGIEPAAPGFTGVLVGEIIACEPHPEADRLRLCQVDIGEGSPVPVVCGAPNAGVGLKAPLAMTGAELPGGIAIRRTTVRGAVSDGMLCSAKELGLSEDAAGLMALPADAPVGKDLRSYLELDDTIIELELTPNRGDCLGMAGVAREVGVLTRCPVTAPDAAPVEARIGDALPVELLAPADCPRYLGRVVRGVNPRAETPVWLRERLRRAGVRPLAAVVDVTNYVMLELGQPMHAFDLGRLSGGIRVRRAEAGEQLALLNGETVTLDPDTLVIADHEAAVAMAGVMGGADSAVGDGTVDVFLEAAFFAPTTVAGRARTYGIPTDASHRFERGVDPQMARSAMERATRLLIDIVGGRPGPVTEADDAAYLPRSREVTLRPARVAALLGCEIPRPEIREILQRLGLTVADNGDDDNWRLQVPVYRFDIAREVDLIEEVARVWGYERIPLARTPVPLTMAACPERRVSRRRLRRMLVDRGYQEAVTYSFVAPELQRTLDPEHPPIALSNPISSDLAVMRTSLWPGLVQAVIHNRNRQHDRVRLFEAGLRFRGTLDALEQSPVLAAIATGPARPEQWGEASRAVDFFDVKGDVQALLALTGEAESFAFAAERHPALHPGQCARIYRGERPAGWLGALHPAAERALGLGARAYLFELDLGVVEAAALPAFQTLSRFPAIRRDLAVVVDETVTAEAVRGCIASTVGEWLRDVVVFDVYRGVGVPDGQKSLAMGLILQDSSRTLTDSEVEASIERVVGRLRQELDAGLRE